MAVKWDWGDFWSCYIANPEKLQSEVDILPEFLQQKSTRVQLEVLQGCPKEIISTLLKYLTMDAQIELLK